MSGPGSPVIAVENTSSRWSWWWLSSGVLFIASALLAAFRSLPGSLDAGALVALSTSATVSFGLALAAAGAAAARRDDTLRLPKAVVVALFVLAIWVVVSRPLLDAMFDMTSAAPIFIDALVKLGLSGVVVAGVLRSPLPKPWRFVPAITLAAVVLGSLMEFALLSGGSISDVNTMILVSNVLILTRILAAGALGAVALQAARSRAGSVVVFGG